MDGSGWEDLKIISNISIHVSKRVPGTLAEGRKPIIMLAKPLRPCALVPRHILHRDRVDIAVSMDGSGWRIG
jgi:hypothetical protein